MKKNLYTLCSAIIAICYSLSSHAQLTIHTFAGNGTAAYTGDGGAATSATLSQPYGVAVDGIGNVYVADYGNSVIRKIDTFGVITTIAGTGTAGFGGDGGPATAALLDHPRGIASDAAGNIYFSDYANLRIRMIKTSGIISTIAGTGFATYGGDGGPATAAAVNYAWGVAVDGVGNVYIADQSNCRIRRINAAGTISTIAGTGVCFISGDGGPATAARIQLPLGVACDASGNVYIADYGNNRIRKVNTSGIISTIAGSPTYGFTGDGGPSTAAKLYYPEGVATDAAGNVYICDLNNSRIREISTAGIINTIAGNGTDGFLGDGGAPVLAEINRSTGVAVGPTGKVYICDNNNNRIRVITFPAHNPYFTRGRVQRDTACPADVINIDSLLSIYDSNTGVTDTWSVVTAAVHGVLLAAYSAPSSGSFLTPSGLAYSPSGYVGNDSFKIRVTNGIYSDTTNVYVTILPLPQAGSIAGTDSVCPGNTISLTDTIAGGVWGSTQVSVASVSATGVVTGITAGTDTITYSVTNICGTAIAKFPIRVRSHCPAGVPGVSQANNALSVFPNPNNGTLTVTLAAAETEEAQFTVTNIVGEVVKEFSSITNHPVQVVLDVPAGIYFCSAIDAHGRYVARMTVVK